VDDFAGDIPFRGPSPEQLANGLERCHSEFATGFGQAISIRQFAVNASTAGVRTVIHQRAQEGLLLLHSEGLIANTGGQPYDDIAASIARSQHNMAEFGLDIAAIVLIHNALERFYWRLIRFGVIKNRKTPVSG
jgi:hypothetical protein